MKLISAAVVVMCLTNSATAQTDWKAQTLVNVKANYSRILDASWSQAGSLWLFANPADISWETVTSQIVCLQMEAAGKPQGEEILVSWFENAAALQGHTKRIAQFWCE